MFLRVLLGLMILPAFIVAKDTALDQMAGHHCLTDGSGQAQTSSAVSRQLSNLCIDVDPAGKRTHVGTHLLQHVRG